MLYCHLGNGRTLHILCSKVHDGINLRQDPECSYVSYEEGFYSIPTSHSTRLSLSIRFGLTWHRFFHAQCHSQSTACSKLSGTLIRSRKKRIIAARNPEILWDKIHSPSTPGTTLNFHFVFHCPYTAPI